MTRHGRTTIAVAACVLLLHAAALWALHFGIGVRKPEVVVPVQMLARMIEPTQPMTPVAQPNVAQQSVAPKPSIAPNPTPPKHAPRPRKPDPAPAPAARKTAPGPKAVTAPTVPVPSPSPTPASIASASTTAPVPPNANATPSSEATASPGPVAAPAATPATVVAAGPPRPAPLPVELPSSDAQYLQNPRPRYPPISLRLREQGTVLVDVLVSDQGLARDARIKTSSGFFRLDNAAVSTVLTWRFVPGKRAGIAQSMWFTVPIVFSIQ